MKTPIPSSAILFAFAVPALAQHQLPILDVHLHASAADQQGPPPLAMCTPIPEFPAWDPVRPYRTTFMALHKDPPCDDPVWSPETDEELMQQTIEAMVRRNVVGVLSGSPERVARWMEAAPGRFIPGLEFNVAQTELTPDSLRALFESGRVEVLAEVTNQYAGIAPGDKQMEAYWALAEELDIPVGIHIGPGPPGVHYLGVDGYRAHLHSALTLEPVVVRHPKIRIYIMHAGFPMLDDVLALLYAHPQVYVGVGVIVFSQPRAAFYRYLQSIVEAGFAKRVMFGSDQMVWPAVIERAIETIEEAPSDGCRSKVDPWCFRWIMFPSTAALMRRFARFWIWGLYALRGGHTNHLNTRAPFGRRIVSSSSKDGSTSSEARAALHNPRWPSRVAACF